MRDAFASRNMGTVVRAYRFHPAHGHKPLPQETVSRWLGTVTQSQLSRIESGRNRVDTDAKMVHWARALKMPADLLWFKLPEEAVSKPAANDGIFALPGGGPLVPATGQRTGSALADALLDTLNSYSTADNLAGPQSLVGIVPQQLKFVDELVSSARGKDRPRLLYVAARYAEFAGWIYQDTGSLNSAMQMSSVANDYAQEADDDVLSAYILMRKSNIASQGNRQDLALKLATDALVNAKNISPRQTAVIFRQLGNSHALRGDEKACEEALENAFKYVELGADVEDDVASYCTPGYLQMEAARCRVELGRANEAIAVLQQGLSGWQPEFRRELGVCLSMLAVAHASDGQVENSLIVAERSLTIAQETGSFRTESQLARIPEILKPLGAEDEARILDLQVKSLRS